MYTKFEGQVNEKTFTDRRSMQEYINYCIENGIDIYSTYSKTYTTNDEPCDCDGCEKCNCERSCIEKEKELIEPWPTAYDTVDRYLAPKLNEYAFAGDSSDDSMIQDTKNKLEERALYLNRNFLANCDSNIWNKYMPAIKHRLHTKSEWCAQRCSELKTANDTYKDRISIIQKELETLNKKIAKNENIYKAYDMLGGYCDASLDIIEDAE